MSEEREEERKREVKKRNNCGMTKKNREIQSLNIIKSYTHEFSPNSLHSLLHDQSCCFFRGSPFSSLVYLAKATAVPVI